MDIRPKGSDAPLTWNKTLYVGTEASKYEKRIRKRLDRGKSVIGHYLITIAEGQNDELDLISTTLLTQDILRARIPLIVGLAYDRREALDLLVRITDDCVRETGGAQIRKWLLGGRKEGE